MKDENITTKFTRTAEITPITQKNNVKRLFPHRGRNGSYRNLNSAIDGQKRSANQRWIDWVLTFVIAKDVGNRDILERSERGQNAAQEDRHFFPLVEEGRKKSDGLSGGLACDRLIREESAWKRGAWDQLIGQRILS